MTRNYKNYVTKCVAAQPDYRIDPFTGKPYRIPMALIDEVNELKLTGGYNTSRDNLCQSCFTYKSANGKCNCQ